MADKSKYPTIYWDQYADRIITQKGLKEETKGEWHGPCPACGEGHNRFWIFKKDNGELGVHCRQCEDFAGIMDELRHDGLLPTAYEMEKLKSNDLSDFQRIVPYHIKKNIPLPKGAKLDGDNVVVAILDKDGNKVNSQTIPPEGKGKRFEKGKPTKGCFLPINGPLEGTVYLCEGWATAVSVSVSTSRPAVFCLSSGNLPEVAEILRESKPDCEFIVAADHDKSGIEAAEKAELPFVHPFAEGEDWSDVYMRDGKDAVREQIESLGRLVEATPVEELSLAKIPPRRWAYGYKLVRGFISILAAPAGVGKSAWSASMALDLCSNKKTLHDQPHGEQKVWLVNLEDPREETLRKIAAAMLHSGKSYPKSALNNLYVDSGRDQSFIVAEEPQQNVMVATPQYAALKKEVKRRGIDVLILDPFVRAHHVNENANKSIDYVMDLFAKLADECDISVLLVHHTRKGFVGGDSDSIRGSSSMVGAARVAFTLSQMTTEEASQFNIDEEKRRSYIRVDNAKANLSKPSEVAEWFLLDSVKLDNGNDEYPDGDSVQVAMPWNPPDAWDDMNEDVTNEILRLIEEGLIDEDGYKSLYSDSKNAKERWAGNVIRSATKDADGEFTKSEKDASKILKAWLKDDGLLRVVDYQDERQRKPRKGIEVIGYAGKVTG